MTVGAVSSAALCSISVSKDVLEQDLVLQIFLKLVQTKTHQVQVKNAGSTKGVLSMSLAGSPVHLTQRNSILRSLVGAALHGAQDHHTNNCLGGGLFAVAASAHGTSQQAALNQAGLTQWMSVADQLRKQCATDTIRSMDTLMQDLDRVLLESAYVLPYAATATLADLDLCVALLQCKELRDYPSAVSRWMTQVMAVLQQLAAETGISLEKLGAFPAPIPSALPTFFYGTEDADAVLSVLYKDSSKQEGAGNNQKKQQGGKADSKKPQEGAPAKQEGKKQEKAKKEDKSGGGSTESAVSFDVTALDIRVGKIIKAWPHETADKLYCEEIDLGNGEVRQIASGLRPFYQVSDLQDRVVLVLCNLKKRTLVGFPSHGMVLCASNADHTSVEFVVPPAGSVLGERVAFEGLNASAEPEPETKVAKKKIFELLAPDLKTDADGNVVWKTHAAKTSAGAVTALNKMANASVS